MNTRSSLEIVKLISAGVTLNSDKCEFSKAQLKFLGHIVNQHGPEKTKAILNM